MQLSRGANRLVWALMLAAIVALGYQFQDTISFFSSGTLVARESETEPDTVRLRWIGKIEAPMAARLSEAISEWGRRKRRFVLELASPGGSVSHGAGVVRMLRDLKSTHALETVVLSGDGCLSMCVPIFLQGSRRIAAPGARFMFHEVRVRDQLTKEEIAVSERQRRTSTDMLFDDFFKPAGVSASWITVVRHAMRNGDVWRTGRQLVDEKSGIVTDLR